MKQVFDMVASSFHKSGVSKKKTFQKKTFQKKTFQKTFQKKTFQKTFKTFQKTLAYSVPYKLFINYTNLYLNI